MRKLVEYTLITLDGVIGEPARWSNFDEESAALALKRLVDFDARAGYEYVLSGLSESEGPYVERLKAMPKCLTSRGVPPLVESNGVIGW